MITDPTRPSTAHLSLGSNLGDRLAALRRAVLAIGGHGGGHGGGRGGSRGVEVLRVSPVYQTAPMYVTEQPAFLNMAMAVATDLPPHALLAHLHRIEGEAGRLRAGERNGPRPLDIDIIGIGDTVLNSDTLTLPHPRAGERAFVLAPLADIAPHLQLPGSDAPVRTLLSRLADAAAPARFAPPPAAAHAARDTYTISLRDFRGALTGLVAGDGEPPQLCLQAALTVTHPGLGFPDDIAAVMSYESVVEDLRDLCATARRADALALARRAADLCLTWPAVHRVRITAKLTAPRGKGTSASDGNEATLTASHAE